MKQFLIAFLLTFVSYVPSHAQTVEELEESLREKQEATAEGLFELLTEPEGIKTMRNIVFLAAAGEDQGIDPALGFLALSHVHVMLALMFEHLAVVKGWDPGERFNYIFGCWITCRH